MEINKHPDPPRNFDFRLLNRADIIEQQLIFSKWIRQKEQELIKEFGEQDPATVSPSTDAFIQGRLAAFREVRREYENGKD